MFPVVRGELCSRQEGSGPCRELEKFPQEPHLPASGGHSCVTAKVGHAPHRFLDPDLRLVRLARKKGNYCLVGSENENIIPKLTQMQMGQIAPVLWWFWPLLPVPQTLPSRRVFGGP